jgi:spore germination protein KB
MLFPKKNIYQILDELFGKKIGKIIILIFMWHTLYLGSIVLCNFAQYINVTTLPETPILPISICLILISLYLAKSGIKTIGRWGPIILTILIIVITFTFMLSLPVSEIKNIMPIMESSFDKIINSAFSIFLLPFSELIVILGIADQYNIKNKEKKTFILGVIIDGILLLTVLLRNILVLGVPILKDTFFSSYEAARILELGEFLTRIEGVITINFILGGITKITLFIISLSKGIGHLSNNNNYRKLVIPASLLVLSISPFLFDSVSDMFDFETIFGLYAIPIQLVLPIVIWIFAEYKNKKGLISKYEINPVES